MERKSGTKIEMRRQIQEIERERGRERRGKETEKEIGKQIEGGRQT